MLFKCNMRKLLTYLLFPLVSKAIRAGSWECLRYARVGPTLAPGVQGGGVGVSLTPVGGAAVVAEVGSLR